MDISMTPELKELVSKLNSLSLEKLLLADRAISSIESIDTILLESIKEGGGGPVVFRIKALEFLKEGIL